MFRFPVIAVIEGKEERGGSEDNRLPLAAKMTEGI